MASGKPLSTWHSLSGASPPRESFLLLPQTLPLIVGHKENALCSKSYWQGAKTKQQTISCRPHPPTDLVPPPLTWDTCRVLLEPTSYLLHSSSWCLGLTPSPGMILLDRQKPWSYVEALGPLQATGPAMCFQFFPCKCQRYGKKYTRNTLFNERKIHGYKGHEKLYCGLCVVYLEYIMYDHFQEEMFFPVWETGAGKEHSV